MEENTFWATVWVVCGVAFTALCLTVAWFNVNTTNKISAAIMAGGDPIKVGCSLDYTSYKAGICTLAATK